MNPLASREGVEQEYEDAIKGYNQLTGELPPDYSFIKKVSFILPGGAKVELDHGGDFYEMLRKFLKNQPGAKIHSIFANSRTNSANTIEIKIDGEIEHHSSYDDQVAAYEEIDEAALEGREERKEQDLFDRYEK